MKSDIEIASQAKPLKITQIAQNLGLSDVECYGHFKAKISPQNPKENSKLILVTATSPTPYGEGKTTTSIGLADGLKHLGKSVALALREPSLGPVFGIKGGAAGGGWAQLVPMVDLNLHFTGDFAAISSANNLICAMIDSAIFWQSELDIDPEQVLFSRAIDMNDRALREIEVSHGLKGKEARKDGFVITAACEIMAVLCLAADLEDLKQRIGNILVAFSKTGKGIFVRDLGCADAVAILLKDAIKPNLIQSLEHTPAIIHGGPFANIAHGCNSIIATKSALGLADFVVTEAGFGSDLGAQKFIDIKCRTAGLKPSAVVLVTTVRSLKFNSGLSQSEIEKDPILALKMGQENLIGHIQNLSKFGLRVVVSINKFSTDTKDELDIIAQTCQNLGVKCAICEAYALGGKGATELANAVLKACEEPSQISYSYQKEWDIVTKLEAISKRVYGASGISLSPQAQQDLQKIEKLGLQGLDICVAKTQYSFSDDAKLLGRPKDFKINIKRLEIRSGAGFIVAVCGAIMLMPGLGKHPAALDMRIDASGAISGLS